MKRHTFLLPLLLSCCAGCSSMNSLLAYGDRAPAEEVAAAPVVMPPAAQPESNAQWCQRISANARERALAAGFDSATQSRLAAQEYQQCLTMGAAG